MKRVCEGCKRERGSGPHERYARKCPSCGGRFVPAEEVTEPVSSGRPTSKAAAKHAAAFLAPMRRKVLEALIGRGGEGGTDEELMIELGTSANGVRPRRVELESMGLVGDSGKRRKTKAGLDAIVWRATLEGARVFSSLALGEAMCKKRVLEQIEQTERTLKAWRRTVERTPCRCGECTSDQMSLFASSAPAGTAP